MANVQDHHIIALDRVVDPVGVQGGWQDTYLGVTADHANQRVGAQSAGSVAEMLTHAACGGRSAVCGDVAADVAKVVESAVSPTKVHDQGLLSASSTSSSEANSPRLAASTSGSSRARSSSESW